MGLYGIKCVSCGVAFHWSSDDTADQRCANCRRINRFDDGGKMKASLTFSLPDEQEAFDLALSGPRIHGALHDLSEHLRQKYKHATPPSDAAMVEFEDLRKVFYETLEKWGLEL